MNDIKFVNGLRAYKPSDNAPDFVKANLTINRNELMIWLQAQGENIKLDLKESKGGAYYFSVNNFVSKTPSKPLHEVYDAPNPSDDLPF